ncbi:DUF481 domain-containing protein [Grimontia hollisae]|uniref:DUF481 domain-containing protein n=2 Tax=Grimontia hollisae TaxID=673 RepID=D0I666_GRIHO|nr:DUF481 domain-containing protein [Grimontia hollisae]AMG31667.1 DUF481 domain-containing protein [Grimontia hollisae]EEY72135.1 hypothetical protein VHA_001233 [Grimontia hollisae CIP 101886]MDF2186042.1 DUF481 domain-containing protein [Grimontia hollisae]STO45122.1 Protein of uncharacterised function, DUF481 [Grimontia hollisae]STO57739.1 Protein of uncharacterised function, DUF481 [Grimontia hollisae]
MKKHVHSLIATGISLSFAPLVFAETPVTMYDYDEATSAYEDAYLDMQFNLNDGNQDQSSYNGYINLDYEQVFDSADRNTKIDFTGTGSRSRGPNATDKSVSNYQAVGALTNDMYFQPNSNGLFWYGKGEVGVQKGMKDPFTKLTVGFGYGRVVNATPMAKSIRLIEALQERAILSGMDRQTYIAVADVISREEEYISRYGSDEYLEYWIEDIDALLGDVGARGAIRSYDVLENERISTRKYGWLVRGGVGSVISNYDGSNSKPVLELGAEYHLPINNLTQFSEEAIMTAILDDGENGYVLSNDLSLTYELSDNIDWENGWLLTHSEYEKSNDITTNSVASTFRYYISNSLSLSLTGLLEDTEDNIDGNGNDEIDRSLLFGMTYRLK